jgi:hypothetical protein
MAEKLPKSVELGFDTQGNPQRNPSLCQVETGRGISEH